MLPASSFLNRSSFVRSRTSSRSTALLPFGAVAATLILGAGVFSLPVAAARVGLLPLVVGLVLMAAVATVLYRRVAALIGTGEGGDGALGAAVVAAGAGTAGRVLSVAGSAAYSVGACVAYAMLGAVAVVAVVSAVPPAAAATFGVAAALGVWLIPSHWALARRLASLLAVWSLGVAAIGALGVPSPADVVFGLVVFVAGMSVAGRSGRVHHDDRGGSAPVVLEESLTTADRTSVTGLVIQLGLMVVLAASAAALLGVRSPTWVTSESLSFGALIGPFGVVLFALVGTGLVNLGRYRPMSDPGARRRVVDLSMLVVIAVQVGWLLAVSAVLDLDQLGGIGAANTNTASGLGVMVGGPFGPWLTVVGAAATLIAVTNAANGFLTSLAVEVTAFRRVSGVAVAVGAEGRTRLMFGAVAVAGAAAQLASSTPMLDATLAVSGIAGGGIIVFVLPLLSEANPSRRRMMAGLAGVAAVVLSVWAASVAVTAGAAPPATIVALVMALTPAVAGVPAAVGVYRAATPARLDAWIPAPPDPGPPVLATVATPDLERPPS